MAVSYPRAWVEIDGRRVPAISASVSRTAKRRGDSFAALLSITKAAEFGMDLAFWTDFQDADASIIFATAYDGSDERVMATGKVSMPNVSLGKMRVSITGKDKSFSLTQKKRNEKFANQKPKDVAGKIAKDHDLTLEFEGEGDFSGKQYDQDTASLVLNRTDFETLTNLAEQIGYRWFVDGSTLYMQPKDAGSAGSYDVVWVPPQPGRPGSANVMELSLRRDMEKARKTRVVVKSWHHRSKKLFKHEAEIDGQGNPLVYEDHHNGKTQAQVEKLAKARARDLVRHELGVSVRAPGDIRVDVRQTLNLSGTGTIYDQSYAIDAVTWDLEQDGEGGGEFSMVIEANAAKQGRDPDGEAATAPGGAGSGSAPQPSTPLPPPRPPELGGITAT